MRRIVPVLLVLGVSIACPQPASAERINACSLLPKEEVKKYLPWEDFLDVMPIEEAPIGTSGSACDYPTLTLQVLPFSRDTFAIVREKDHTEAVDNVGDEAYFHNNQDLYAELYVKVGERLLTLQASGNGTIESLKPDVVKLAAALVERMN